jgi:hypothetical protein
MCRDDRAMSITSRRAPARKTTKKSSNSDKKSAKAEAKKAPKLSRTLAPIDLAPIDWQRGLRRQFGQAQPFLVTNLGNDAFFSNFQVRNLESKSSYCVCIRGGGIGDNDCGCLDFATNELGTCKHIEFVLAMLLKKRGAKAALARGSALPYSELYLRNDGARAVHFRAGSDCPELVRTAAAELFEGADGSLASARFAELGTFTRLLAQTGHELRASEHALDFVASHIDLQKRKQTLARLFPHGSQDKALKNLLKTPLYPYQAEGALFAVQAGRALIGDDMGLGKTIQAIAAAEILARHFGVTKVLVICPTSLKYQWQSEIKRFAGHSSRVMAGGRAQRQIDYTVEDFCKITNYEKLQPDLDLIAAWAPELVIVDEAQRIKNWHTIAARALKRIDSTYAVVLTGTPLENKLEELISIVQFVDQHRLGPTWKLLHEHQRKDEAGRVIGYLGLEKIGQSLAPIMLRRRKSEVLTQLPARTDQKLWVPMTEQQMVYHQENAEVVSKIVLRWRRLGFLTEQDQRRLTCALQNMRMSCNSTYLLDQNTDHGVKADELMNLLEQLCAQPDAKVVVFSQWTRTQDIIIKRLQTRGLGYVCFHGGVPAEKRPGLVQRFQDDPQCRVFLSTDAGATGLNLQHASTLVNMDLPWNPALLEQRISRIYRMGQKQPVRIINFVAKGTIEEGMLSVLAFKRSLAVGVLDGGSGEISLGGSRLQRFMKDVDKVTSHMGEAETMNAQEADNASAPDQSDALRKSAAVSPEALEIAGNTGSDAKVEQAPGEAEKFADAMRAASGSETADTPAAQYASPTPLADPWQALAQIGTQLIGALHVAQSPQTASHPWIERSSTAGPAHLKIPLPKPETMRQLADAFSQLAQHLASRTS